MKKLLAVLLALTVVTGAAIAQPEGFGRVRTNFAPDFAFSPDSANNAWIFMPHFRMGLRGEGEVVNYFVQGDFDNNGITQLRYRAAVDINNFTLSVGRNELPWARWSSLAFLGNINSGFGASNTSVVGFIQGDISGFYFGLTEAGMVNGSTAFDQLPGFYLGYDQRADDLSFGFAFAGISNNAADQFSWMVSAFARFNLDPVVLGVNLAFYAAPMRGFFALANPSGIIGITPVSQNEARVLEAMLDANIPLDAVTLGITCALIMNFAEDNITDLGGGSALRLGFSANFDVGGGFRVIPGAMLTTVMNGPGGADGDNTRMALGVTFLYNF
ncbi:MAG: hypothetical protein FWC97_07655 [Treponema sp.]|nr:hypothetical protein [Treponema sp.]